MLHSDTLSRVGKSSVLSRLSHIQCNHRALLRQIWERHLLNPYPCCFPMCRSFPAQAMEALPGPSVICLGIACPGDLLLQLSRADHHLSPWHYAQSSTSWGDYPCGKMSLEFLHFGCSLDWYPPPGESLETPSQLTLQWGPLQEGQLRGRLCGPRLCFLT